MHSLAKANAVGAERSTHPMKGVDGMPTLAKLNDRKGTSPSASDNLELQASPSPIRRSTPDGERVNQTTPAASPTPFEKMASPTSDPGPSRDTTILAQLYHSSRRSRHGSTHAPTKFVAIQVESVPPPPLVFTVSEGHKTADAMKSVKPSTDDDEWSFNIAPICNSSSSNSLISMASEEGAVTSSDTFDEEEFERETKRRKIALTK